MSRWLAVVAVGWIGLGCSSESRPGIIDESSGGSGGSSGRGGSSASGGNGASGASGSNSGGSGAAAGAGGVGGLGSGGVSTGGTGGAGSGGSPTAGAAGAAGIGGSEGGAGGSGGSAGSGGATCPAGAPDEVLFLGNSYTAYNNLPTLIEGFAAALGCPLSTERVAPGGARFETHAGNPSTLDLIRSRAWDAVVLQNQSQVPGFRPDDVRATSLPHAQTLAMVARENDPDPRLVYFVTWGRQSGDSQNCGYYPLVCNFEGHTQALLEGYTIYASDTGGELSPVGPAWQTVVEHSAAPFPPGDLWSSDGSHPSAKGSYLAAAVLFYTLFDRTPVGLDYDFSLDASEAEYLRQIAANTVDD